jgi:SAM-dependent methyltransferase
VRENIKESIEFINQHFTFEGPIVEIGSYQTTGQEGFADLRPLFPMTEYIGCDMRMGEGVDQISNAENLSFNSDSIGSILCLDTLEHMRNPFKVLTEIHRVLKPGGIVIISSLMAGPIHDHPFDYWRFTPKAFETLLDLFPTKLVISQGNDYYPHTILGLGIKKGCEQAETEVLKLKFLELQRDVPGFTVAFPSGCKVVESCTISTDGVISPINSTGIVTKSGYYFKLNWRSIPTILCELKRKVLQLN